MQYPHKTNGHVLFLLLIIIPILYLAINNLVQTVMLEYYRTHNQMLQQQLWLRLEMKVQAFMRSLQETENIDLGNGKELQGYVPDTLEFECKSGVNIYTFTAAEVNQPESLVVTYSISSEKSW